MSDNNNDNDNDSDNDSDNGQFLQSTPCNKALTCPEGLECFGLGSSLFCEGKNSLDARQIKQCVPLRSVAAWSKVGLESVPGRS